MSHWQRAHGFVLHLKIVALLKTKVFVATVQDATALIFGVKNINNEANTIIINNEGNTTILIKENRNYIKNDVSTTILTMKLIQLY